MRTTSRRGFLAGTAAVTAALGTPAVARASSDARSPPSDPAETTRSARDGTDDDLSTVVDEAFADAMAAHDIVGAAVAVVEGDDVVHRAGYGTADGERPVDPAETVFRIGSVTKPLVATALMALVEAGELDPEAPIGEYLTAIDPSEPAERALTVADLVTHTAGFEERFRGTWVDDPGDRRSLPTVLAEEQPSFARAPGERMAYSNYGWALAGQVLADVHGTDWETALEELVLEPLGMTRSSARQPPTDLEDDLATGYVLEGLPGPELALEVAPAGSAVASVTDLARFARAHLGAAVNGERLLAEETLATMQDTWFTHHERLAGSAFGFLEGRHGTERVCWHNGAIPGSFYTHLAMIPDRDVAVAMVFNTSTGAQAAGDLVDTVFETLVPSEPPPVPEPDGAPHRADELEGTYRGLRVDESTDARLPTTLQAGRLDVTVGEDGTLIVDGGSRSEWVEVEPLVFARRDGSEFLAFQETDGEITHCARDWQSFERVGRLESPWLHGAVATGGSLALLSAVLGWPAWRAWRYHQGDRTLTAPWEHPASAAKWTVLPVVAALTLFVVLLVAGLAIEGATLLSDPPLYYRAALFLPVVAAGATLLAVVYAGRAWLEGYWGLPQRIHYTLVVLGALGLVWLSAYWNLFGFVG